MSYHSDVHVTLWLKNYGGMSHHKIIFHWSLDISIANFKHVITIKYMISILANIIDFLSFLRAFSERNFKNSHTGLNFCYEMMQNRTTFIFCSAREYFLQKKPQNPTHICAENAIACPPFLLGRTLTRSTLNCSYQ